MAKKKPLIEDLGDEVVNRRLSEFIEAMKKDSEAYKRFCKIVAKTGTDSKPRTPSRMPSWLKKVNNA